MNKKKVVPPVLGPGSGGGTGLPLGIHHHVPPLLTSNQEQHKYGTVGGMPKPNIANAQGYIQHLLSPSQLLMLNNQMI